MIRSRTLPSRLGACALLVAGIALAASIAAAKPAKQAAQPANASPATESKADAAAPPAGDAAQKAMMEAMAKTAAPGPQHELLKGFEGSWTVVTKSWMAPGEPQVSQGTAENHMILGGRYLEQRVTGSMMGQPFEGWGLDGYDNTLKKYQFFWVDNAGTGMMIGSGDVDATGKVITMDSTYPAPDGTLQHFKTVTRLVDDKTYVFSMSAPMNGQDHLVMESTYTRK